MTEPTIQPSSSSPPIHSVQEVVPRRILDHLTSKGIDFQCLGHPPTLTLLETAKLLDINPEQFARGVVLKSGSDTFMAVVPASHMLDFSMLCEELDLSLTPATPQELALLFRDCEKGCRPPMAQLYRFHNCLIDKALLQFDTLYFEPGTHQAVIKVDKQQFLALQPSEYQLFSASLDRNELRDLDKDLLISSVDSLVPKRIHEELETTTQLPLLPAIAQKILELSGDDEAGPVELSRVVKNDPALASQVIAWAQSPYYGFAGHIDSIEDAIMKVLGYDLVMNLSLGLALGKPFDMPVDGPLGAKAYWRFSVYTATTVEALVNAMPADSRPPVGLAYLSGLLHNIGHLVLGHMFRPYFFLLNHYVDLNPEVGCNEIEQYVLKARHTQIGAWLMQKWNMREEVIAAVRYHHNPTVATQHEVYAHLVHLAVQLLKQLHMGDASDSEISEHSLKALKLTESDANDVLQQIACQQSVLDEIALYLI